MLYCNENFTNDTKIKSQINQKINSYKNQDIKKIEIKDLFHMMRLLKN